MLIFSRAKFSLKNARHTADAGGPIPELHPNVLRLAINLS